MGLFKSDFSGIKLNRVASGKNGRRDFPGGPVVLGLHSGMQDL